MAVVEKISLYQSVFSRNIAWSVCFLATAIILLYVLFISVIATDIFLLFLTFDRHWLWWSDVFNLCIYMLKWISFIQSSIFIFLNKVIFSLLKKNWLAVIGQLVKCQDIVCAAKFSFLMGVIEIFVTTSRMALEPNQPPSQWVPGTLLLGKYSQILCLATQLHLVLRLKMCWSLPSHPLCLFWT
jgi:hypothetical protein